MGETSDIRTGHCLCGAVTVTARLHGTGFEACHCNMCQRWTGGGPYHAIRAADLEIRGEENIRTFRASDHGERANCTACGSPLYWRLQGRPIRMIAVGLLDDQTGLHIANEIFVDHRPEWMPVHEGATQETEAENLAQLKTYLEMPA